MGAQGEGAARIDDALPHQCGDHFEDGITDSTEVIVQAYPLEPFQEKQGAWVVRQDESSSASSVGIIDASVGPTKRSYKASNTQ